MCSAADLEDVAPGWWQPPVWFDGVDEADVAECPEQWAVPADAESLMPLSVAESLLAVSAVGPGPEAIRLLASLSGRVLSGDQRLSVVQLMQAQVAWVAGAEQQSIVDLVGPAAGAAGGPERRSWRPRRSVRRVELAPALHTSVDQAKARIARARLLAGEWKVLGDRLRAGTLDPYRVWLITETLSALPDPARAAGVLASVLPGAAEQTPTALKRALRKAARQADPDWGVRSFAKARKSRRVGFDLTGDDGLVRLWAFLPPVEGLAVKQQLEAAAKVASADPEDHRCADERMADALVAAVLGSTVGDPTTPLTPKVRLNVLVPLPTLLGLREDTGELLGYGDLPAGVARELAADADWQRWVHDPVTGHLLDQGGYDYRVKAVLHRFLVGRDRYCRFPGSARTAESSDLEHNVAFDTHRQRQRRDHLRDQHVLCVPHPAPGQNPRRLQTPPPPRRHHHLDHPARADLHHPPLGLPTRQRQAAAKQRTRAGHRPAGRPATGVSASRGTPLTGGDMLRPCGSWSWARVSVGWN